MEKERPKAIDDLMLAANSMRGAFLEAVWRKGITPDVIAGRLKQALNSKRTETIKVRGTIDEGSLKKGVRILATATDPTDKAPDETVLAIDFINHRQRFDTAVTLTQLLEIEKPKKIELSGADGGPIEHALRTAVAKELIDEVDGATAGLPNKDR